MCHYHHTDLPLPQEIVIEILQKVPSKSLIRFKSLSKPLCSLLGSSHFLVKHLLPDRDEGTLLLVNGRDKTALKHQLESNPMSSSDYFMIKLSNKHAMSLLSYDTLAEPQTQTVLLPPYSQISPHCHHNILGSNGLMCLFTDDPDFPDILVWDPATGDVRTLPPSDVPDPDLGFMQPPDLGFGYDASSQDYKVIRLTEFKEEDGYWAMERRYKVEIYSFNADSWRGMDCIDIYGFAFIIPDAVHTKTYTDGVFYWCAFPLGDWEQIQLLWFRMSDDSFGVTNFPANIRGHGVWDEVDCGDRYESLYCPTKLLALSHETVALIVLDNALMVEKRAYVWVLLEFGVDDSWTLLFSIGPLVTLTRPLSVWKDGKTIMEDCDGNLVLCDPFTNERKTLDVNVGGLPRSGRLVHIVSVELKYIF